MDIAGLAALLDSPFIWLLIFLAAGACTFAFIPASSPDDGDDTTQE